MTDTSFFGFKTMTELPDLTKKQQLFVMQYVVNGNNASEAYRSAYDCSKMSNEAINVEASKMLKNPKIALWIEKYKGNVQEVIEEEIKYSVKDAFDEFEELKNLALESKDKYGIPKIDSAIKVVENKCKLKGLYTEKVQVSGGNLADVLDKLK